MFQYLYLYCIINVFKKSKSKKINPKILLNTLNWITKLKELLLYDK